jgi:hypothetical protein
MDFLMDGMALGQNVLRVFTFFLSTIDPSTFLSVTALEVCPTSHRSITNSILS